MKKITLASLFGALLVFTINVNASATLSWEGDVPGWYSDGSGTETIVGMNTVDVTKERYSDDYAFSDDWKFSIDADPYPGAWVSSLSITFFDAYLFDMPEIFLDGESMGFGVYDEITKQRLFEFSKYLEGTHILTMAARNVNAFATYSVQLTTDVKLTPNPIPASVWLFGSAMLGVGGLASRRKPLPVES